MAKKKQNNSNSLMSPLPSTPSSLSSQATSSIPSGGSGLSAWMPKGKENHVAKQDKFDYGSGFSSEYGYWGSSVGTGTKKHEDHPECLIKVGGIELAGFPKSEITLFYPAKRLVINATGTAIQSGKADPVKKLPDGWDALKPEPIELHELLLDWTDRAALPVKATFWAAIWDNIHKLGYDRVEVCCIGGHGRTGTALCCLLAANPLYTGNVGGDGWDLIQWLRKDYCKDAVESIEQIDYVEYVWEYYRGEKK